MATLQLEFYFWAESDLANGAGGEGKIVSVCPSEWGDIQVVSMDDSGPVFIFYFFIFFASYEQSHNFLIALLRQQKVWATL